MLPQKNRLTKSFFKETHPRPNMARGVFCTISYFYGLPAQTVRFAVIVPKSWDKRAVERNRMRRRIYAIIQEILAALPPRGSFVVRVHGKYAPITHDVLKNEIATLIRNVLPR